MFSFRNKCVDCGKKVHTVASGCIRCKTCMKNKQKEYGANHRKKMKGLPKPIPTPKTPKQRYSTYKLGAIKRNHAFELTEEQFMTFWDKPCHYCEQPINGVGIDRLDNTIGYLIDNCVPCCTVCNMMKFKQSYKHFIAKCVQIAKAHSAE